jgi:hypothetical protein
VRNNNSDLGVVGNLLGLALGMAGATAVGVAVTAASEEAARQEREIRKQRQERQTYMESIPSAYRQPAVRHVVVTPSRAVGAWEEVSRICSLYGYGEDIRLQRRWTGYNFEHRIINMGHLRTVIVNGDITARAVLRPGENCSWDPLEEVVLVEVDGVRLPRPIASHF